MHLREQDPPGYGTLRRVTSCFSTMYALGNAEDGILKTVDELLTVLDSHDTEMVTLEKMTAIFDTWDEMHEAAKCQIKESIMALTEERNQEHERIDVASVTHSPGMKKLVAQRAASEKHQEEVGQQVKDMKGKLADSQSEAKQLQEKYHKVQEEVTQELASLRHTTSLYSLVSGIRWKYESDEDDINGYVSNKMNVKPFQLNTKQNSRFFITNHIWNLIDAQ